MSSIDRSSADPRAPLAGQPAGMVRALPSLAEAFRVWLRVAALSFGGPAG